MNEQVAQLLAQSMASAHGNAMANVSAISNNLMQGLGVVQTVVIQSQGSVSDDSGLIAALQTAARSPDQGAIK